MLPSDQNKDKEKITAPERLKRKRLYIPPLKINDGGMKDTNLMATDFQNDHNANGNEPNMLKKHLPSRAIVTTTSQLQTNSQTTSTTTRVKSSSSSTTTSTQRLRLASPSDLKADNMRSDLVDFKNNMNDMKNSLSGYHQSGYRLPDNLKKLTSSLDNLVNNDGDSLEDISQPVVTYPDESMSPSEAGSPQPNNAINNVESLKFEQKTTNKKTKVIKDGLTAEKESTKHAEMKKIQAGDLTYEENKAAAATRARLEIDGISAEKSQIKAKEARSLKTGDVSQQESKNLAHTNLKLTTDKFSTEKSATESQQQSQTITASGIYNQEQHSRSSSTAVYSTSSKGISTSSKMLTQFHELMNGNPEDEILYTPLDDLEQLSAGSNYADVERAIHKYTTYLDKSVKCIQEATSNPKAPQILDKMNDVIKTAWAVPTYGHELGYTLCNALRKCGGLDLLLNNCTNTNNDLQFHSAKLLEQCLTTENRDYVVEHGLDKVVKVACVCIKNTNSVDHSRVGTGILEHLFKHSEETCSDVVKLGGLDALLFEIRKKDVETLRHCAGALANLSLYGGAENQETMIERNVQMWLFPLAFHTDDNIKYYACLAITVLVANAEIEAVVIQSGTLDLVEPFVTIHNPSQFAKSNLAHAHGQSKTWLKRLVPVLSSKREEARNLAAFHFCMEAGIKRQQGNTNIFQEIGAVEALKKVASCPNAVASKYAAQALRLIGEEVPHKLSQQVPLWSSEDVEQWVRQIGFSEIVPSFVESRVDGDLLLQLTEDNLKDDIGLTNGIKRKRFTRELQKLKRMADYTSRDSANINNFLQSLGPEFCIYTYSLLNAGIETKDALRNISEDQLLNECSICNSIHRYRIMEGIRQLENRIGSDLNEDNPDKSLDVFVSYRRSNGSQLASLLKVHLQLRGFSVFIDVERLEAGKFDNNLLQSIQKAKHFLLVLTPNALERCKDDHDKKDWVHREIVAALSANCNIIPIIDNFTFPEPDDLPEDMRQICHFNAVRWIHDYQDACVDKLERFMRGELNTRSNEGSLMRMGLGKGDLTPGTPSNPALVRQPPSYQRMHSNDSGSGKGSDKDMNGLRD
ncbi:sterile alpha and TIR motif-containing protein 1 isoform X4 [Sitophilus oryzae]|uniref:ADP-ribosyl cyclase/cyclic ADP-ribose hydrolase n=1 Tax=Sitophilus oryzae TaxID=7048 RepID=A0A6J2Y0E9_SITOR|nr:sterile alpha and TIR motif-containing protein 1 isoform X4 [Sitophilus oryzae]